MVTYAQIVKEVNAVLEQYTMRLTLRQVYYRLVSKNLIPNTPTSYKGLSHMLVKARESGDVNGDRIEDRGRRRQGHGDYGWENPTDFMRHLADEVREASNRYQKEMWTEQPKHLLVALEKDALSRLFVESCEGFRVHVYATRGYGSYTFLMDMAGDFEADKENVVLYFGDYDPSGRDIERDLEERLIRYGAPEFEIRRIALTEKQINEYKLPPVPEDAATLAKLRRDPRTQKYGMNFAVELDALEPPVLQQLIQTAISGEIDAEKWESTRREAEDERAQLEKLLPDAKLEIDGDEY